MIIVGAFLGRRLLLGSRRVTDLLFKDASIFVEHLVQQGGLAHARGTDHNERLAGQGSRVERMEVFLSVHIDIILFEKRRLVTFEY